MTRLKSDWISDIQNNIDRYDIELKAKLGFGLMELACLAVDLQKEELESKMKTDKIYIIPITSGQGEIGHFAESIKAIIDKMGFNSTITKATDVAGYYEAIIDGANVIFMADDNEFIAMNLKSGIIINNNEATAKGFFAAFRTIYEKIPKEARKVALLGAGKVGSIVLKLMAESNIDISVLEIDSDIKRSLQEKKYKIIENLEELINYDLIFDASSQGDFIQKRMLKNGVWFIGPGVPISLSSDAILENQERIIHDYLPIGVSTMLTMAYK
jgi:pyrrolysine biosynthesis protein PylD